MEEVKRCSNCINREIFYEAVLYPGIYSGGHAHIITKAKEKPNSPYGYYLLSLFERSLIEFLERSCNKASETLKFSRLQDKIIMTFVPPDPLRRSFSPYLPKFIWKNIRWKRVSKKARVDHCTPSRIIRKELLTKTKTTPAQKKLPRQKRLTNLEGVFQAREKLEGETVILIDDVATTGSTLNEASRTLKEAGASQVICLIAAFAQD